jgi:hypothetical protein
MPIFKAAERCQGQIKIAAEKESFSQKCSQVLEELHAEAMSHIRRKNRQEEQGEALRRQTDNQPQHLRSEQPQYSEQFASTPAASAPRQSPKIPEFTFGSDWQDMSFVGLVAPMQVKADGIRIKLLRVVVFWVQWIGFRCRVRHQLLKKLNNGDSRA